MIEHRKALEGDPIIEVLERTAADAVQAAAEYPDDPELADLRDWLATFLVVRAPVQPGDRPRPGAQPAELERLIDLLARIPDDTILRLVRLLGGLPDEEVLGLVDGLVRACRRRLPGARSS